MVFGFALLGARLAAYGARGAATVSKTATAGITKTGTLAKSTPWSSVAKVGAVGGTVGVAGAGIGSAISSVDNSIAGITGGRAGGGFLVVGGLALVIILLIFMRRK
mgnify:FL=1|jgi:hypothetical protein